ncbi:MULTISPECIES: hypothetical protein [Bacillus]|uniref:PXO1-02 n=4 Tax=Bacillus cereus group TaxID=86661 RepID=A1BYF3_BACCE|nr:MULTISPECIES: hypothetical protein [Bacillus]ACJ82740.1 conserved hypothetical protein [Bacillus cereus AH187]EJR09102.1 hypothetical protein II7_04374 [Bacillus cereus MSX-A12]EJR09280.1 hypothetical protein II9_05488 [Bacillus cereus MSX-D12]KXY85069.1 hypothetical protein AT258_01120 [Bacillus wiedmannii]MDV8113494.1 hypothetical protein [Bacillus sp. BAU-SS-2023]BAL21212.1 conserved hypothetical protein [Bacillus cereus NC7401]
MDSMTNHIYKKRMLEHTIVFTLVHLVPILISTSIIYLAMELSNSEWHILLSYEGIFTILFLITRFLVFQTKTSILSMKQYEKWFSELNIILVSIFLVSFAGIPALLQVVFILQMALTFYLLERSCLYIERLTIHNLYTIQEIICDKKQLKIDRIIPYNEEHGTLTIQTKDEQYFLYRAVYLSGILSPITKETFAEYERSNLMGR